tara:strand:+ start:278 stop:769 length:492 start_codon:yes stop_codon:yes gene_type:complete
MRRAFLIYICLAMPFNVVLLNPEIPNNTGNIGRLCLGTGSTLHLIKPLGFSLEDKQLKRSGLDYWPRLSVKIYDNWEAFLAQNKGASLAFYSSHASQIYWDLKAEDNQFFIFGSESKGLPATLLKEMTAHSYKIPLAPDSIRSFNLANAVSIVLFDGLRQQRF